MKFQEMPYERPDLEKFAEQMKANTEKLRGAGSYAEARQAYFDMQAAQESVDTLFSIAYVRNTIDTRDEFYEGEVRWLQAEMAKMTPLDKAWQDAMAECPYREEFTREFGPQLYRDMDAARKLTDERLIEAHIREGELRQAYQKDSALATTEFRGESCNFYGLLKHMESTDREERREAYLAWAALYEKISPQLDAQYDELVKLRAGMAKTLGFPSFIEMAYLSRGHYDYTPEDTAAFRRQIREIVTPTVAEIRERQRKRLGLDRLCYYDEALLFAEGNANPEGTTEELVAKAQRMYREMSPETGEFFDFMVDGQLFDLETRPGKRMGGYMTRFPGYKAPFIFSNFNGTSADVDVLTHEAGHAFQGYIAMRSIAVQALSGSTAEINETHSMSMEHFAYPWMPLFFGKKSEQYKTGHLIGALAVLPYMCVVDEFQHRVYEKPEMTAKERRAVWREIEKAYMPWRDYDGVAFLEEGGFWMQKQHIFLYPFYYLEYALAQMNAFQYYGRMKENREAAWQDYLTLCRAGGTKGYFELLEVGKLLNPFREGTVEKSVRHVIEELKGRY